MELPESIKTSLLGISAIFVGVGGAMLTTNIIAGSVLLLIAVGILVLRGWLKKKGIEVLEIKDEAEAPAPVV